MPFVITCGDEGIQLNQGTRIAIAGAGFRFTHFSDIAKALKSLFGKDLYIASSDENEWTKQTLGLVDWEQVNASMQQHIEALADREKLIYVGHIPFTDPKFLSNGVKGHMVRPHNIHVANKICFTLGGGEQTYNLGNYVVSADWLSEVPIKVAREGIMSQVEFYQKNAKRKLQYIFEEGGSLGEKVAQKNRQILEKILPSQD